MVSLEQMKNKQTGFTIVELLIVIVIIAILAGLVITTFVGIQARARDSERQTDINAVQKQIEAYYAEKGAYPTAANLNSATWRSGNNVKIDSKALSDPSAPTLTLSGTTPNGAAAKAYSYSPLNAAGTACEASTTDTGTDATMTTAGPCAQYTLSAWLEAGKKLYTQSNQ